MGLFDFWKKKTSDPSPTPVKPDAPEAPESRLQGDLIRRVTAIAATEDIPPTTDDSPVVYTSDSTDSVVFLTFAQVTKKLWICPECGTTNDEELANCVVCGLNK